MIKMKLINVMIMFIINLGSLYFVKSLKCYEKFELILTKLPKNCQNQIFSVFRNNTEEECCDTEEIVSQLKDCFQKEIKLFSLNKTIESRLAKKGLGSIKSNQFIDSIIIQNETTTVDKLAYNSEIRSNLKLINENNKLLSKCINMFLKVNTYLISKMCMNPSSLDKYFVKKGDQYIDVIVPSNLNLEMYNECSLLAQNMNELNNNYLNFFIKNLNYLIGIGSCNYYSDTFSFKLDNDVNDIFFPYSKINNESLYTESYEVLLNKWLLGIIGENYVDKEKIVVLNSKMKETELKNPSGLSISLGRKEINYNIIMNTFYLEKYKSFFVECYNMICHAYCQQCNTLIWEKDKVMTDNIHGLYVSCVNQICLVYIENLETKVSGGEIYYIRGSSKIMDIDPLLVEKLENAKISLEKEFTKNKKMFINTIDNIKTKPEQYKIDFNMGSVFYYYDIQVNFTHNISLIDYLYNHLYKGNEPFSFECDNLTCNYIAKERKINYNLYTIKNDTLHSDWRRFLRGSSGGGRSGSSSSHTSFSGIHSSTKSTGSSLTHSSSSSTKSGGSSLTSTTKFSGFSSSKNSGSSLTKSSTSVSHINMGSSLSKSTTYNSNTNWKPVRTWHTGSSSSTSTSTNNIHYYTHSSYPTASNSKVYTTYHSSNLYYSSSSHSYYYYSYRPNYYIHYYYFPHWSHYNYHYIDNHYYYHYRAHSVNDYHNNTDYYKDESLNQLYDPNDWVISFDMPENKDLMNNKVFDIYVECSPYFCINYVKNNEKNNIFIDVLSRNLIFLNENSLDQGKKLRLIRNLMNRKNDSNDRIRYSNTTKDSDFELPYNSFPVKYSCFQELYTFLSIFNYSEALNSRAITQELADFHQECLNGTISNDKKTKCGLNLYQSLTKENFLPESTHFNYLLLKKPYFDLKINEEKFDLASYNSIVSGINFEIEIDGSTNQKETPVKENEVQLYEKLTSDIINFGKMDEKAFSSSNIMFFNIVLLHLIIYCFII